MGHSNQHPVTRAELRAELRKYPTRVELQRELRKLATKEELKKLATKEELRKLATKEELKKLATKEELQEVRLDLAREIIKLQVRLERVEQTMATKDDIERIITAIDGLAGQTTAAWNKLTVHGERLRRLEVTAYGSSPPPPE